jgi:erythromycin esterase
MKTILRLLFLTFVVTQNFFAQEQILPAFINANSIEIAECKDSKNYFFLDKVSDNKRIIAIGEASHGSETLFEIKHSLFKYLAINKGYTLYLIEDDYGDLLEINEAIVTGKGDLKKLIIDSSLNGFWKSQSYLNFFQWMQNYNQTTTKDKLQVIGVDCQDVRSLIANIQKTYSTLFTSQYEEINNFLQTVKASNIYTLEKSKVDELLKISEVLLENLKKSDTYLQNKNKSEYKIAINAFETVSQNMLMVKESLPQEQLLEEYKKYGYLIKDKRSELMAKNAIRAINDYNAKAVASNHNSHVVDNPASEDTGYFLRKELGEQYYIICTDFSEGSIQVFSYNGLKLVKVDKPEKESIANYCLKTGKKSLFVEFSNFSTDKNFTANLSSLAGGYKTIFPTRTYNLPLNAFDAIIYTKKIDSINFIE